MEELLPLEKEMYLSLSFKLREAVSWAGAGHVVATGQTRIRPRERWPALDDPTSYRDLSNVLGSHELEVNQTGPNELHIATKSPQRTTWVFDLLQGRLTSWTRNGCPQNILATPLTFDIYRALTNNDAGGDDPKGSSGSQGREWRDARVHLAREHPSMRDGPSSKWKLHETGRDVVEITVTSRIAPPSLGWGIDIITTYRFMANTRPATPEESPEGVHISVHAVMSGPWLPPTLPRFGLTTRLRGCHSTKWFGRGPGESYRDKKESQLIGLYARSIDDLFMNYDVPQENGNRTDVRWVEFRGQGAGTGLTDVGDGGLGAGHGKPYRLLRATFGQFEGASFSAGPYTTRELDDARHPFELKDLSRERRASEGDTTVVHLDFVHHGLGTGSCGPETLPEYSLYQKEFHFELILD